MSYFGIITCHSCGQKVSLTPQQVVVDRQNYGYFCRRCRVVFDLPADFIFKHPSRQDLGVQEAIQFSKEKLGFVSRCLNFFSSKNN